MILGKHKGKYVGKSICGFISGFEYEIDVSNNGRTYMISAIKDLTLDKDVDFSISYASEISINKNWEIYTND